MSVAGGVGLAGACVDTRLDRGGSLQGVGEGGAKGVGWWSEVEVSVQGLGIVVWCVVAAVLDVRLPR